jgi:hypothetical protein
MKKQNSWKTTLFGGILATLLGLQTYGVKIGHVGNGDFVGLATAVAAGALGASSRDHNQE